LSEYISFCKNCHCKSYHRANKLKKTTRATSYHRENDYGAFQVA